MENIRTIKGVNRETWLKFKEMAARKGIKMGDLFENMTDEYEKNVERTWNIILNSGKALSDEEAEDMLKTVKKLRKEKGFRNVLNF